MNKQMNEKLNSKILGDNKLNNMAKDLPLTSKSENQA